jgi:hypothetical protein
MTRRGRSGRQVELYNAVSPAMPPAADDGLDAADIWPVPLAADGSCYRCYRCYPYAAIAIHMLLSICCYRCYRYPHAAIHMPLSICCYRCYRYPYAAIHMLLSTCCYPHAAIHMLLSTCCYPHAAIHMLLSLLSLSICCYPYAAIAAIAIHMQCYPRIRFNHACTPHRLPRPVSPFLTRLSTSFPNAPHIARGRPATRFDGRFAGCLRSATI